ncbi:hypothetical protein TWF281_001535 [Arthrobotrys megalospora]
MSTAAGGPSKAHEEPDDLEDYVDSEGEEEKEKEVTKKEAAAQEADRFLAGFADKLKAAKEPSQEVAPVTAPLVTGTGASSSLSTPATSTEESEKSSSSSSPSMASGQGKTVSGFGSSVSSLSSASGAPEVKASADIPQVTSSSESKTTVVATPAAENNSSPSHPVTVSSGYTAQESLGSRVVAQAPQTTPPNPLPLTSDDMDLDTEIDRDVVMRETDEDGDMSMPEFDPDVEMPDAPPLCRRRSRGVLAPRGDTPIRRRYRGLPSAPVRRIGERTADRKNAARPFSKVIGRGSLFGRDGQS